MSDPIVASVVVRAARVTGPYRPLWNWFGYDEPNYTYSANGKRLLRQLTELSPEPVRIRVHNLLTSGDGTASLKWGSTNAYQEDAAGNPVYDWTIIDRLFDTWIEAGNIPFVQVGFTPEPLSDHPGSYRHAFRPKNDIPDITTGWAAPPNDLSKWAGLVEAWARHLVERYGEGVVGTWPWEVWNEPDGLYWTGTVAEYCAMYDATAEAIRRVLPEARIGGPHTCGPGDGGRAAEFLRSFLAHIVENGSILDFVAFHAKGRPVVHDGHVRMGLQKQLRDIEAGLSIVREFPQLAGLPVILGESDPEGCAACSARVHPRNAYRNGPLYGAYTVEQIMRTYDLSRRAGIEIDGAVTWAFLFEDQPYFDGFRDLATNGIDKAVLNAFRMLGLLAGKCVETTSDRALPLEQVMHAGVRDAPDINAAATRDGSGASVLVWHYHDDDLPGPPAEIRLTVQDLPAPRATLRHFRMDAEHSNAFAVWQDMGSPQTIAAAEYDRLRKAGGLAEIENQTVAIEGGTLKRTFALPRQGVSLIRLDW